MSNITKKLLPLFLMLCLIVLVYAFDLNTYITLDNLKLHHEQLNQYTHENFWLSSGIFIVLYSIVTALALPFAALLTITSGFLFGIPWGALLVVIGATLGATCLFLAVRYALADWVLSRSQHWVKKLQKGFEDNAFSYLLTLRLVPLFPFGVVNIVPSLLNMRLKLYVLATAIGIIPGTTVYAALGNGLKQTIETRDSINFDIIFEPYILIPLMLFGVLSLLPVVYKRFKKNGKQPPL